MNLLPAPSVRTLAQARTSIHHQQHPLWQHPAYVRDYFDFCVRCSNVRPRAIIIYEQRMTAAR